MQTHQNKAASFLALAFGIVVVAISAGTSYGFFYTFFGGLIPSAILPTEIGSLISGGVGVVLFDVASVTWLTLYLHHAETAEQRALSLIMTVLTFLGSAAASVAYIGLTADGQLAIDATTAATVSNMALGVVIIGIIANFGAMQAYTRFSHNSKRAVSESNRRDMLQAAEDEQAVYLDKLISQQVKERLAGIAPDLAAAQAARLVDRFYRGELAKYEGEQEQHPRQLPPPTGQPRREQSHREQLEEVHHRLQQNGNGRPLRPRPPHRRNGSSR
jgi:hypothetical protein